MTVEVYDEQKGSLAGKSENEGFQGSNEAKAQEILPILRSKLRELVTAKVPAPEVVGPKGKVGRLVEEVVTHLVSPEDIGYWINGKPLETQLAATVPLEDGATRSVTISASGYPGVGEGNSIEDLCYRVSVEGLDSVLVIAGSKATIESKERKWDPVEFFFC